MALFFDGDLVEGGFVIGCWCFIELLLQINSKILVDDQKIKAIFDLLKQKNIEKASSDRRKDFMVFRFVSPADRDKAAEALEELGRRVDLQQENLVRGYRFVAVGIDRSAFGVDGSNAGQLALKMLGCHIVLDVRVILCSGNMRISIRRMIAFIR